MEQKLAHPGDWRRVARGRRHQSSLALKREDLALKLAEEPSRPLGLEVHGAGKRQAVRPEHPQVAGKMAKGRCASKGEGGGRGQPLSQVAKERERD